MIRWDVQEVYGALEVHHRVAARGDQVKLLRRDVVELGEQVLCERPAAGHKQTSKVVKDLQALGGGARCLHSVDLNDPGGAGSVCGGGEGARRGSVW